MNKFKITKGYNLQLKGSPNNILDMIETEIRMLKGDKHDEKK